MGVSDFFKRIKEKEKTSANEIKTDIIQDIQIEIEGDIGLFKDEKEQIMQGAKQLLDMKKAENMEDAIITVAVMLRGLKFRTTKKTADGKTIVVLRETANQENREINDYEIEL